MAAGVIILCLSVVASWAATKSVDLDGDGIAESTVTLNVLSVFPARVQNVVTNRAVGEAFTFTWFSAGPGGFSSSVAPGTATGVGTTWEWQTSNSIYSFTGNLCSDDICFTVPEEESGPGGGGGAITREPGRSPASQESLVPGTPRGQSNVARGSSGGPGQPSVTTEALAEGTVVGPFSVPGRTLTPGGVTVSSASLTSSLITFFSPRKVLFSATSTVGQTSAGQTSFSTTLSSFGDTLTTVTVDPGPPGCCPNENQLNCEGTCVDYLTDALNCGECGVFCNLDIGEVCDGGSCVLICSEGLSPCLDGCKDLNSDEENCGGCGNPCDTGVGEQCLAGTCQIVCPPGQVACGTTCVDLTSDPLNCGGCGVGCNTGIGELCDAGNCTLFCPIGQVACGDTCADLTSDPLNCGACGNVCGSNDICTDSACFTCMPPQQTACDNRCTNVHKDPENCGECGIDCNELCPSDGTGACSQGESCFCIPGATSNSFLESATISTASFKTVSPEAISTLPPPAPVCETEGSKIVIPPGGSQTIQCDTSAFLAKEVLSTITVCGSGTPDGNGICPDGTRGTVGVFNRLAPDPNSPVGSSAVLLNPVAVSLQEPGGDHLWQPGETADVNITVANAGFGLLTGACATISSPPQDLTPLDGIDNPTSVDILNDTVCYPDILGVPPNPDADCTAPILSDPAAGLSTFTISLPQDYLGDTSRRFILHFTGNADGVPFSADVPITLGISGSCDPTDIQGDYDGLDGLQSPMAALIPEEDPRPLPFPPNPFNLGNTRPLKLNMSCGGLELDDTLATPPQIVALFNLTTNEPVDITIVNINDSPNVLDPFFRYNASLPGWIYNMRTKDLRVGQYKMTIRIADRKDYVTGFELAE